MNMASIEIKRPFVEMSLKVICCFMGSEYPQQQKTTVVEST